MSALKYFHFATALLPAVICAQGSAKRPLVIGVLSYESGESSAADSTSRAAERGLQLGIEEAQQTARLFGRDVREKRVVIKRTDDAARAARVMARTTMMSALIVTNPELIPAAESVGRVGYAVVVMRTLPSAAPLDCSKFVFAVYPPDTDLHSLRNRWEAGGRYATRTVDSLGLPVAALWHSSLERFGALELNDRYRARWKTGMTSEAWAAWVAVKILSEASLRKQSVEPFLILDYITKSEFDGHKGWPLTFRAEDHFLRQPIYMVSAGADSKVAEELPRGSRSETQSASQVLDAILPPHVDAACGAQR